MVFSMFIFFLIMTPTFAIATPSNNFTRFQEMPLRDFGKPVGIAETFMVITLMALAASCAITYGAFAASYLMEFLFRRIDSHQDNPFHEIYIAPRNAPIRPYDYDWVAYTIVLLCNFITVMILLTLLYLTH